MDIQKPAGSSTGEWWVLHPS